MSSLHQRASEPSVSRGDTSTLSFASALIVARAERGPRGQVTLVREESDIYPISTRTCWDEVVSKPGVPRLSKPDVDRARFSHHALVELNNGLFQIP